MTSFVESARCTYRHCPHVGSVTAGHAPEFLRRHAVTRACESVETIAAFRWIDVSICENRHRLRRVIKQGIEVREIICLRVDGLAKLVTHAELETQLAIELPTVCDEGFSLSETEKAHRIE